ncbi:MAG: hypothetical protein C4575_00575 [Desulforudis sp.]|jgi:hypothetical protein|nr:MAG: hypothetical protein C4575_00575 [Desulforudis sp.]
MSRAGEGRLYLGLSLFVLLVCILASVPLFSGSQTGTPPGEGMGGGAAPGAQEEGDISEFCTEWLKKFYATEQGTELWTSSLEPVTGSDYLSFVKGYLDGQVDWREVDDYLINTKTFLDHAKAQEVEVACLGVSAAGGVWKAHLSALESYSDPSLGHGYEIERSFYLIVSEEDGSRRVVDVSSSY